MIQLAICDDDIETLSQMSGLVEEYRTLSHVDYQYSVFHNGFDLMSVLEKRHTFDIYCLDILMPNFSGIELAKEIRSLDQNAQIIFFTSSSEFALESYSVRAVNYVLKPVTKEKLFYTLTDVLEGIEKTKSASVIVKSSDGIQKIPLSNLMYAEALGKKTAYHLISGRSIECSEQFSTACEHLIKEKSCFLRTHRSYLVNMNYIDTIGRSAVLLQTGTSIPIAQGRTKEIKERFLAFQMEEN